MQYKSDLDKPMNYELPESGLCKVKIVEAIETVSQSGNPMVKLKCEVLPGQKGQGGFLYDYIVDNPEKPEQFSSKAGSIFRSCQKVPEDGEINNDMFVELEGSVMVRHEEYKGMPNAKIYYWLDAEQTKTMEEDIPF